MKGFRVESQRLGAAQTETVAHQVSVATLDTPRSCIASNATTLTKIAGSGGPSLRLLALLRQQ